MARRGRPLHIVLDFDGTITQRDTTAVLGSITSVSGTQATTTWTSILNAYLEDYNAHAKAYHPPAVTRKTLVEEAAWLSSTRSIELRSVRRVEEAGFFRGATTSTIAELAARSIESGDIVLRRGWEDVLSLPSTRTQTKVSILSVNWSRTFIRQILLSAALKPSAEETEVLQRHINSMEIHANEIEGLEQPTGSEGKLGSDGGIRTSGDKLACLRSISESARLRFDYGSSEDADFVTGGRRQNDAPLNVYVGDSTSDLQCLAATDVGVCMRDEEIGSGQRDLAACFTRVGFDALPVELALADDFPATSTVYWTRDMGSVARVLRNL